MTMAVSDIETQDLLKSIDAKLDSIVTIMAKNANATENATISKMENVQDHRPNMVMDDPFGPHPNIYEQGRPAENADVDEIERAEKWIGKLCWFSQIYECHQHLAILKRISESGLYVTDDGELYYAYCEPVKPDSELIYHGE